MNSPQLPNSWRWAKLSELGEVNRGRSRHRPRYAEHLYGGPYPFIQTGDVKESGGLITSYRQTYSEAGLAQSRLWPTGTMCITIAANIAETGVLTFPACFPDSVVGFIPAPDLADVRFIEYSFRYIKESIQRQASGSVQDNINLGTLERLRIPVPPIEEQRAIAHILGTLDDKIELNRQMNQTLDEIARTLFRSWFVDFDPVRAKAEGRQPEGMDAETAALFPDRFVDSELGPIPEDWEWRPLDEIGTFLNGLALQKYPPRHDGSDLPVIKIAQLRANSTTGADMANAGIPSQYHVEDGDFLFSWSGSLLASIWSGGKGALNQHLFKVTSEGFPKWFVYHWVQEHLAHFQRVAADKATTMGHINRHHLSSAMCAVPASRVFVAADRAIRPLMNLALGNALESRTLADLRDTLLPELLSGRLQATCSGRRASHPLALAPLSV